MFTPIGFFAESIVYDTDAQLFFNAIAAAGGALTLTEKSAVNTLVIDLKAESAWTNMKAIYPLVGGSQASTKFNLKDAQDTDAAFRLVYNGTVTINSNGIQGDNVDTTFVDTFLNPNSVITSATSWQMGVYSRTSNTDNGCDIGSDGANGNTNAFYGYFSGNYLINFRNSYKSASSTSRQGLFVAGPNGASNVFLFRNGTQIINAAQSALLSNAAITLLGNGTGAGVVADPSTRQLAFAFIYNGQLPSQSNFYTIVQAFQTTLGRQV